MNLFFRMRIDWEGYSPPRAKEPNLTLKSGLIALIQDAYAETWSRFATIRRDAMANGLNARHAKAWKTPGEPALVSGLFEAYTSQALVALINKHLPHLSGGQRVPVVTGIFVHQKPKVRFGSPAEVVEIGDLLFVRHHFQLGNPTPQGWAFLMQAKHCRRAKTGRLTGKEGVQFDLYADWDQALTFPAGELGRPPSGRHWNLGLGPPPTRATGLYGLVAKSQSLAAHFPDASPWSVGEAHPASASACRKIDASVTSLAAMLEDFLQGKAGRSWHPTPHASDHWSHFVRAMIENALAQRWGYSVQRIGVSDAQRAQQAFAALAAHQLRVSWSQAIQAHETHAEWQQSVARHEQEVVVPIGEPPEPPAGLGRGEPQGALSLLYVATYGEEQLDAEPH